MAEAQQTLDEKKLTKKRQVRKEVYEKLAGALAGYKGELGEKKFRSRLKKASKLFAVDIARAAVKNGKRKNKKKSPNNQ